VEEIIKKNEEFDKEINENEEKIEDLKKMEEKMIEEEN
jgi:hypothetical protein